MRLVALVLALTVGLVAPAAASHRYVPHAFHPHHHRAAEGLVGTEESPMYVHNSPNVNNDGGSWAWADYGQYQTVRANKPSPAAHALCQIDQPGDAIWVKGGMMQPGRWVGVQVTVFDRLPSDVDVAVLDPDGAHGGDCSAVGLALRRVQ